MRKITITRGDNQKNRKSPDHRRERYEGEVLIMYNLLSPGNPEMPLAHMAGGGAMPRSKARRMTRLRGGRIVVVLQDALDHVAIHNHGQLSLDVGGGMSALAVKGHEKVLNVGQDVDQGALNGGLQCGVHSVLVGLPSDPHNEVETLSDRNSAFTADFLTRSKRSINRQQRQTEIGSTRLRLPYALLLFYRCPSEAPTQAFCVRRRGSCHRAEKMNAGARGNSLGVFYPTGRETPFHRQPVFGRLEEGEQSVSKMFLARK